MVRYAIYGINRVEKDFRYMFQELEIICYFEQTYKSRSYRNCPVYDIKDLLLHRNEFNKVIICDFEKEEKALKLENLGLMYTKDYLMEEDFFGELDSFHVDEHAKGREIILWGTGNIANRLLKECPLIKIDRFFDSDQSKNIFQGKRVYHPGEIEVWNDFYVIIAMRESSEVVNYLEERGSVEKKDYVSYEQLLYAPSALLRKTIFDRDFYDFDCNTMKNHFEINDNGDCAYCCAAFQSINGGNLLDSEFEQIWSGNLHKIMCLTAENHTYTFCDKEMCPLFFSGNKQCIPDKMQFMPYGEMEKKPNSLLVAIDKSCNLNCITCRDHIYIAKGNEKEKSKKLAEIIIQNILPGIDFLIMAGNGEVFFSEAYRKIYLSEACAKIGHIRLLTNGLLFTEKNWEQFYANNRNSEVILTVSIDAAQKETYEKIRRNGSFEVIQENMELASRLKKNGKLSYIRMNFVVQKENYLEMPDFVKWAEHIGADEVFFTKILNWGTYTGEVFKQISMMEEDGVTAKEELKKVLADPVMKSEIVELGTIRYQHRKEKIEEIENYYEWELLKRNKTLF